MWIFDFFAYANMEIQKNSILFLSPEMKEQRICLNAVGVTEKKENLSCFNFQEKYFFLGISQCFHIWSIDSVAQTPNINNILK